MKKKTVFLHSLTLFLLCLTSGCVSITAHEAEGLAAKNNKVHQLIKARYLEFLVGNEDTFKGPHGNVAHKKFLSSIRSSLRALKTVDFSLNKNVTFRAWPKDPNYKSEFTLYSKLLQQIVLPLAYAYNVKGIDSPYYHNPEILDAYLKTVQYLYDRGVRSGMTFHYNTRRLNREGAPKPKPGAANLVHMELRMVAYCQSVLLMEPHIKKHPFFPNGQRLIRDLGMLGVTSGHARYYEPSVNPEEYKHVAESDAMQNYGDTTLVSALLEKDPQRRVKMMNQAQNIYSASLGISPGWADTIKPDYTGFHHHAIYGNIYTDGFIPQAAFAAWLFRGTPYAVNATSIENVKQLMLTFRLYSQKYSMPFSIRGRRPLNSNGLRLYVPTGLMIYASQLGLGDQQMKKVFKRIWEDQKDNIDFLFKGGRGKQFRGFLTLNMLDDLNGDSSVAEADPQGFWVKPYGGLVLHRRDHWLASIKGFSKYFWDYEAGPEEENLYGHYLSHGMLTIFNQGKPIDEISSGYDLANGWDWYRLPGTTAVHFPLQPAKWDNKLYHKQHRNFNNSTFLGGCQLDERNGMFGFELDQETFGGKTTINLKAKKSVFFVDNLIVLLGSNISGGDGNHPIETTLFQTSLDSTRDNKITFTTLDEQIREDNHILTDPSGNGYFIPTSRELNIYQGQQHSFMPDGKTATDGNYATTWFNHGMSPTDASYEAAVLVNGAAQLAEFAKHPEQHYRVMSKNTSEHSVHFPNKNLSMHAFFKAGSSSQDLIHSVDQPCMVVYERQGKSLTLALSNPDLGLADQDASVTSKTINEGTQQFNVSKVLPVEITIKGEWKASKKDDDIKIVVLDNKTTSIRFPCQHGFSLQCSLESID